MSAEPFIDIPKGRMVAVASLNQYHGTRLNLPGEADAPVPVKGLIDKGFPRPLLPGQEPLQHLGQEALIIHIAAGDRQALGGFARGRQKEIIHGQNGGVP